MMIDKLIEPDSLQREDDGASLRLRLPWYRALPLSTVELDAVKLDGRSLDTDRIALSLNGERWPVKALPEQTEQYWFVTDSATLHLEGETLEPGTSCDVEVTLSLYPPYINGLRRATRWSRTMEVGA